CVLLTLPPPSTTLLFPSRRSSDLLQSYCQDRFFHTEFDEDGLNVLTSEAIESLPRTTPLEELSRSFQALLSSVKEEERPLVHEAWKATIARLQEEGVS